MSQQKSSLGKRFCASLIDYIVILCFLFVFVYSFGSPNDTGGYTVTGVMALIPLLFWFVYLVIIESTLKATLGHSILGLKVVKEDNATIGFTDSLIRHLIDVIDFSFFGIPALICISNTPLNQRLGDLAAKTVVVPDSQ